MSNQKQILDECGCCEGIEPLTPASLENYPGLSALAYRVGTHGSFKETMISQLAKKPELGKLTTRDDDDPAVALLDAWAVVLDVLSFYQERFINEGYLRTAAERRSLLELARHISYQLRPGVAAGTYLAFTMESAPGSPLTAKLDPGTRAQSIPGQDELPQVFETIEEIEAKVAWNALKPRMSELIYLQKGHATIYLKGTSTNLSEGDALLIIGEKRKKDPGNENWDFRKVKTIETVPPPPPSTDPGAGYTKVTLDRKLGSVIPYGEPAKKNPKVYALRQQAALFGYNAPDWRSMIDTLKAGYLGIELAQGGAVPAYYDEWPDFNLASLSDPPPGTAEGTGLYAEYYNNYFLSGLAYTRTDEQPIFYWDNVSPHPDIVSENFSVRWTGWVQSEFSGTYKFYTYSIDGARLWVNSQLIIDNWDNWIDSELMGTGTIILEAGRKYDIKLEYRGKYGHAGIYLLWTPPEKTFEAIPKNRLYPRDVYTVHLDSLYKKIAVSSWVVLSLPNQKEVYSVEAIAEDSCANFTLSAKTTRLRLKGERLRKLFNNKLRETVVYAQSELMDIAETPIVTPVYGNEIVLDSVLSGLEKDHKLIITGKRIRARIAQEVDLVSIDNPDQTKQLNAGDELVVITPPTGIEDQPNTKKWYLKNTFKIDDKNLEYSGYVTLEDSQVSYQPAKEDDETVSELVQLSSLAAEDDDHTKLVLKESLKNIYDRTTVTISANVARATHGETTTEVLGSGDGSKVFQEFQLKQKPLTYVPVTTAAGAETTLEIRVNDILWKEVPTFYKVSPEERVYVTRMADDGTVTVQFGDGITGARLPTGVENVKATYRVGIGLDALVKAGQISMLMTPELGVKGVVNPLAPSGAEDPETRDKARQNAPRTVLTMDRVVSFLDYENYANSYPGIGKAKAALLWKGEQQIVHLTVAAADGGAVSDTLKKSLTGSIDAARHPDHQIRVGSFRPLLFGVKARVLVDSSYIVENVLADVSAALEKAFSFDSRDFGQAVTPSEVTAVIQGVKGVTAVDLEKLDGEDPFSQEHFRKTAEIAHWDKNQEEITAAQLLTINPNGIELLEMIT